MLNKIIRKKTENLKVNLEASDLDQDLVVLVFPALRRMIVDLWLISGAYPCLTLVINLVPSLYFCIVSHRACVVCAHGALAAEGAEGCECSPPTPAACVSMMLFRALPSEVCVWLMRPRVLDQGFMEKFTWKKAGGFSWAGANYLFPPRMFLVSQVKIFDTVMI